jgi:hypothetical protein
MNETKFYKDGKIYYKVQPFVYEKIYAFHHTFGIEVSKYGRFEQEEDAREITEVQYIRIKKLILAKLLKN